jgi:hypothetical protein
MTDDFSMGPQRLRRVWIVVLFMSAALTVAFVARTLSGVDEGMEALVNVPAFLLPFILGMALRARERWARWLGVRVGLGVAASGVWSLVSTLRRLDDGDAPLGAGAWLETVLVPCLGVVGAWVSWQLASAPVRALFAREEKSPS